MEIEFTKGEFSFVLKKYDNESYDIFFKRGDFILKNRNSKLKFNELILLSKIFTNDKFKKCKYSNEINKKIKNLSYH